MLELLKLYWVQIYAGLSIVFYFTMWAMKKTYPTKEYVDRLEKRVSKLEDEVKQLPHKDDMHAVELKVNTVSGQIDGLSQQLLKLQRTTEMLLENELQGDK